LAERRTRPSPNLVAAVALLLVAAVLLGWQQPWQDGGSGDTDVASLPADASARLTAQLRDLSESRSEDDFVAATGDLAAAQDLGRRTWRALRTVARSGASFRYVSGGEVADRADGSALAVAEVSWQPDRASGLDPGTTQRSTVGLRVAPEPDGTLSVVDVVRSGDGPVPLWLVGRLALNASAGRTVVRVDGGDDTLPVEQMTSAARSAVEAVVPGVEGRLTVVSPRTRAQMAAIVGQDVEAIAQIAAITTGLGTDPTSDAVVVLNPAVFATMDQRAAQVVLTHEATHALTAAVGTSAANWVVEGFADFVALHDDTASLSVSAGQALAEVRAGRLPEALPADGDFSSTRHGLGAVYESTWMIFRMLAEDHPDRDVVAFYRQVTGGAPVDRALGVAFGLTVDEVTASWRDYLTKSASTVS
jgi:hypothetical protein